MRVSNFAVAFRAAKTFYTEETAYSLQLTNLDPESITFLLEFHVTVPEGENAPLGYVSSVLQASGIYLQWARRPNVVVGRGTVVVASNSSITATLRKTERDERELKGFVVLRVPPARAAGSFRPGPQVDHAVKVLLHARREDRRPMRSVGISDQQGLIPYRTGIGDNYSSEAIAISTGRAENDIDPEGRWLFGVDDVQRFAAAVSARELDAHAFGGVDLLPEDQRLPALVDLLQALAESGDAEIKALNELLAQHDVQLRLQRPR